MISLTCFYSTLPPRLSLQKKLTTAGMFILMRLGVEEAPAVCSRHGTPIWSLAGLTTKPLSVNGGEK